MDLAGVVMLQQRVAEAACGGVDVEYELAIETRQHEARRRNERGAHIIKSAASRRRQALS